MFKSIKRCVEVIKMGVSNGYHESAFNLNLAVKSSRLSEIAGYPVYQGDGPIKNVLPHVDAVLFPQALATTNNDGEKAIFVNKVFSDLDDKAQKSILLHEVGHLELNHLEIAEGVGVVSNEQLEMDADKYAQEHGADMHHVYKILLEKYTAAGYPAIGRSILERRIAALGCTVTEYNVPTKTKVSYLGAIVAVVAVVFCGIFCIAKD